MLRLSVRETQRVVDSAEFTEWLADFRLLDERDAELREIAERRADVRHVELMTLLANVYRDRTQHPQPYTVAELLGEEADLTDEQLFAKASSVFGALGGQA